MPINVPDKLPAIELLRKEHIFIMKESQAEHQDIRPLKILIVNLMPLKIITETDLIRLLSNTPLQIEIDFLRMTSRESKHSPVEHLNTFYQTFEDIQKNNYDGMIITGTPVGMLPFEEVSYWKKLTKILDWSNHHVTSCFFICWGAQAALYHFYKIPKYILPQKMFGVFKHYNIDPHLPIFRGFDDTYFVPHSRHIGISEKEILKVTELHIIAQSEQSGVYMLRNNNSKHFFITGHPEYSRYTLDHEYKRDIDKNLPMQIPENYYPENNPQKEPMVLWKGHGNLLFSNWINYYVYQETPYHFAQHKEH
ncbi:MAG: homoserine O-acetyltransferase MetA [Chitinophagaceae bacterium]